MSTPGTHGISAEKKASLFGSAVRPAFANIEMSESSFILKIIFILSGSEGRKIYTMDSFYQVS